MKKGQTALEYLLIVVVALVIVALVWFFTSNSKTESTGMGTSVFYEVAEDMEEQTSSLVPLLLFAPVPGLFLKGRSSAI